MATETYAKLVSLWNFDEGANPFISQFRNLLYSIPLLSALLPVRCPRQQGVDDVM